MTFKTVVNHFEESLVSLQWTNDKPTLLILSNFLMIDWCAIQHRDRRDRVREHRTGATTWPPFPKGQGDVQGQKGYLDGIANR